jgi:hypothetical protein
MPDTGPPWNIPYVEPTDNPRVYPAASEDLAEAIADALDAAANPGIGSNVVQTVKTDTFSTTSTSFTNVTGLTATITPTSDTSKVLVIAQVNYSILGATSTSVFFRLDGGNAGAYVGDAAGTDRIRAGFMGQTGLGADGFNLYYARTQFVATLVYLDSPATTSPTTYAVQSRTSAGTVTAFVNRASDDSDLVTTGRTPSSITVIEVAA